MKKHHYLILATIVISSLILRLWNLEKLPKILNRDEAALAYNALLISEVGKDEFGRSFPFTFESFGDFKLPGYIYTLAGLFKLLPTTDFVVRLPSALAGLWLILISYFLATRFELNKRSALFFTLFVATTPVFLFYSRIAFEANLALSLFVTALFFLTKRETTLASDLIGLVFVILAILCYNTPLLLLPFIGISLVIIRGIKKPKKWLGVGLLLALVFIFFYTKLSSLTAQKSGITWFNDETTWDESVKYYNHFSGINQKIFGNRYVFFSQKMLQKAGESFAPKFLVTSGGTHPWHALPGWGHLSWPTYLLGLLGLIQLLPMALHKPRNLGLTLLFFAALIPSIITIDSPHATRSLLFFFLFVLFAIKALDLLFEKHKAIAVGIIFWQIISFSIYSYEYFAKYPNQQPASLQVGYEQTIQEVQKLHQSSSVAVVDPSGYQYILTAWYLKLQPQLFLDTIVKQLPDRIGFKYGERVGQFHFIAKREDRVSTELILLEWKDNLWQTQ